MNVFKYLKILYSGKEALINQVSIFSLVGIMVISLSEYLTYLLGNLSSSFLGYAPPSHFVLAGYLFVGLMLLIYFIGYSFDVAKFSQIGKFSEVSLASYKTFVKMFPISIAWVLYLLFATVLGLCLFQIGSVLYCIYFAIIICFLPFIQLISVKFSENFNYHKQYFSLVYLLKVIDKAFGKVVLLTLETIALGVLPATVMYFMIKNSNLIKDIYIQLACRLGSICVGVYFAIILIFVYMLGLADISKDKLSD